MKKIICILSILALLSISSITICALNIESTDENTTIFFSCIPLPNED
ncbi:MAG: hypothetical protein KAX49_04885 [Halanaerobiales bacterium]|nr:hypothetical protein [Halanaerobiales bacterium]